MNDAPDESKSLILQAQELKSIKTPDEYRLVALARGLVKDMAKKLREDAKDSIQEAKQHWDNERARLAEKVDPLDQQYQTWGSWLLVYDQEQERIRKRKQLEEEAENKRKIEKEKADLADLAREMGAEDLAKDILDEPVQPPPTFVQKQTPTAKETGVSYQERWGDFDLVDLKAVPIEYHLLNEVAVRKVIVALKNQTKIPGIKVLPPKRIPIQR